MNDDWKDNTVGAVVAVALIFLMVTVGLFLIYIARSI